MAEACGKVVSHVNPRTVESGSTSRSNGPTGSPARKQTWRNDQFRVPSLPPWLIPLAFQTQAPAPNKHHTIRPSLLQPGLVGVCF